MRKFVIVLATMVVAAIGSAFHANEAECTQCFRDRCGKLQGCGSDCACVIDYHSGQGYCIPVQY